MKIVLIVFSFLLTLVIADVVIAAEEVVEFSCVANKEIYPHIGPIEARTSSLSYEILETATTSYQILGGPVSVYQAGSSPMYRVWQWQKTTLAIEVRQSGYGNYHLAVLSFEGENPVDISLWCYKP